ncbi:NAD-dependent epimerase/dehydratase family protein [Salinicoccus roseus]|uniref:NAD-dependent epimerase/dehydratase family protein n=1 Tax=Salinicoccus roseus TaxID=45670 RepID=UPI0035258C1F
MCYSQLNETKILVTGSAGFIGFFLTKRLLEDGLEVIGIDNLNDYYDVNLKKDRLKILEQYDGFNFLKCDISVSEEVIKVFKKEKPKVVINLAAQAGVRYSLENPDAYIQSNIVGFHNIVEACKNYAVKHLIYASSSSVYGANKKVPFEETDFVDQPVSLYAATKKSNELIAHTYSHLYDIPSSGLRFFTVYGPMGRPDMAYFGFTNKLFNEEPIKIFNNGDFKNDLYRDFTYIDDIVEGIVRLIPKPPTEKVKHRVYNIGNNKPIKLMKFITSLEEALSNKLNKEVRFEKHFEPMQPGDVPATYASTDKLYNAVGFKPTISIEEGLQNFVDWYVDYYKSV